MKIEQYIEVLKEFQMEHPGVDVVVRRDIGYDVPIVSYNITNVANSIAPNEYIQVF